METGMPYQALSWLGAHKMRWICSKRGDPSLHQLMAMFHGEYAKQPVLGCDSNLLWHPNVPGWQPGSCKNHRQNLVAYGTGYQEDYGHIESILMFARGISSVEQVPNSSLNMSAWCHRWMNMMNTSVKMFLKFILSFKRHVNKRSLCLDTWERHKCAWVNCLGRPW